MTKKYTNNYGLPLSVGVWLATDTYQSPPDDGKKYISATGLLKSVRQIVLQQRIPKDDADNLSDLMDNSASRIGTAIHDSIEDSWVNNYKEAMIAMGQPKRLIDRIRVNPEDPNEKNIVPIYMEQRFYKEIDGWVVTGQFDFVGDGRLEDFKTTGTYTWVNNTKDDDYKMQGSIYKWGRPDIITKDVMAIQFIFKDWMKFKTSDPKYPPSKIAEKIYELKSIEETERFIKNKLSDIERYENVDEKELPECTPKELWQGKSEWKYYKNPAKMSRATKNFDTPQEANLRFVEDGSVGIVVEVKPEPTACKYCPVFHMCSQGRRYLEEGLIK